MPVDSAAARGDADVGSIVPFGAAVATWAVAWLAGSLVLAPIVIVATGAELSDDLTIPRLTAVAAVGWAAFLLALAVASRRFGSGRPTADLALRFRPVDLLGVPVGVLTQFLLIPVLYLPLREIWPDTFSSERLEERAQDLADRAGGWMSVLLILVVVVGAPVVEELVYRGLIQRSTTAVVGRWRGLVLTSLWFAVIHFSPVEYPGLFLAGLVFGAGVVLTGRLGPAIVTHAAFNAAGIITVLSNSG